MRFDGDTFVSDRDGARLTAQLESVRELMIDGRPRTLSEIAEAVQAPEASVSARLRDLRKPRFGNYIVEREHIRRGLFRYTVKPPIPVGRLF